MGDRQLARLGIKMVGLKKRKPIVALILSLVTPGLGQIYNGQFKKGISYLIGFFLVYLLFSFLLFTYYGLIFYLIVVIGVYLFILIEAVRSAIKFKSIELKSYNKWYIYLIIFLLSNVAVVPLLRWTVKNNIAQAYKMPASSMAPTLLVGDHLIADMRIYKNEKPQRGDIIIFEFPKDPSKDFIKRVIGMEGEKVEIVNNKIYINDKLLDDPWGHFTKSGPPLDTWGPTVVPKDSLFVLGDNRDNSMDSRFFGFVKVEKVKGKSLYLYWAKDKSRIGMELK
jgi:signal peptidase I